MQDIISIFLMASKSLKKYSSLQYNVSPVEKAGDINYFIPQTELQKITTQTNDEREGSFKACFSAYNEYPKEFMQVLIWRGVLSN